MATLENDRILRHRGQDLYDSTGDKIGSIEEIYLDAETHAPEWALVQPRLFGLRPTFVPLRDATESGGKLTVPYDKATIKDAPDIEPKGQLSQREEADLARHYGLASSELRSDTGLPAGTTGTTADRDSTGAPGTVGRDVSGPTTEDAMTRSEEEIRVGKAVREAGRVRLRKYVVTEHETRTVPVRREEVRVEREPITDANVGAATDGPALSEEEHEVVLHEEEVVMEKRVVPKERVRLAKDVEVVEETVREDVRKERIEFDDTSGTGRDRP